MGCRKDKKNQRVLERWTSSIGRFQILKSNLLQFISVFLRSWTLRRVLQRHWTLREAHSIFWTLCRLYQKPWSLRGVHSIFWILCRLQDPELSAEFTLYSHSELCRLHQRLWTLRPKGSSFCILNSLQASLRFWTLTRTEPPPWRVEGGFPWTKRHQIHRQLRKWKGWRTAAVQLWRGGSCTTVQSSQQLCKLWAGVDINHS